MNRYLKYLNTSQKEKVKFITKNPSILYWDDEGVMHEEEFKNAYLVSLNPGYEFGDVLNNSRGTAKLVDNNVIKKGSE